MDIRNGNCLELMKTIPNKSVDLFICDLPYVDMNGKSETNCKWNQSAIDLEEFWKEFKRIRKSKKTACIHFCSTKFGYTLIKSNEKMYKMDMVWKKRNKTGGLQSRHRPMRNHEMVYFFYEQAPKYNRDKYHKRIAQKKHDIIKECVYGNTSKMEKPENHFEPPNPASIVEEENKVYGKACGGKGFNTKSYKEMSGHNPKGFSPRQPNSIVEEDEPEPVSMFESTKVFIGKRHHQTEKPQDILEFFLKYWSDEGDTILDPTMGSGSTGVACNKLNRKFIGFELDPKIFEVAKGRLL